MRLLLSVLSKRVAYISALCRDLDELQSSFKERYSRLLEKRLRAEREATLLHQAATPPGSGLAKPSGPAPPMDERPIGSRGRSSGSENGEM